MPENIDVSIDFSGISGDYSIEIIANGFWFAKSDKYIYNFSIWGCNMTEKLYLTDSYQTFCEATVFDIVYQDNSCYMIFKIIFFYSFD